MLPTHVYFLAAGALVLAVVVSCSFAAGRRWLVGALPAIAFFALLAGAAELAYQVGVRAGGGRGSAAGQLYTCSMHPQVRQDGPGLCPICHMELVPLAAAGDGDGGPGITIDPVVVQNMGVRVHELARGPLVRTVHAYGSLRAAESREYDVALKVDGFVERLFADTEGMAIAAGAPLFALYAAELVVAQEELIAARTTGDAGLLAAARRKLLLWDVPAAEVDRLQTLDAAERTLVWRSPVAGVLVQKNVLQGAPAMQNQVLLRIADLSLLWLDAQVSESQLEGLGVGQAAVATLPALPGRALEGKVVFVAPTIDPTARTAAVRVEVPNAGGALRPGMFARLAFVRRLADDVLLAPREAVLDSGLRQIAWIAVGKGRFEPRKVVVGRAADGGMVEVLEGLAPGERVVTSGQFLIDSESRLREGMAKLSDDGLMPGGDLPERRRIALTDGSQQQVDALLTAYLAVAAAMAEDRHDQELWQTLRHRAAALSAAPEPELQPLAAAVDAPLLRAVEPDLVAARVAFKEVSAASERLFEVARPSAAAGALLYVQHCPMAEADWLQVAPDVRNPYYGSSMLACGAVRRELRLGAESGR